MWYERGVLGAVRYTARGDGALDGDQYRRCDVLLLARTVRGVCIDRPLRGAGDQPGERGDVACGGAGLPCARRGLHDALRVGVRAGVDPLRDLNAQQ